MTVRADRNSPVDVYYSASDSAGMRRLVPGLTVQQTVGIGVQRTHREIEPAASSCPVQELARSHEIYGTGEERVIILTAGAENWAGLRNSIEPVTIRLE